MLHFIIDFTIYCINLGGAGKLYGHLNQPGTDPPYSGIRTNQQEGKSVALTEIVRNLLLRCLGKKPGAWEDFIDRYMGLVVHVVNHTGHVRSIKLSKEDLDDLCGEVFLAIVRDDFAVLRHFRGQSSLATYLTVVSRRVCVREMMRRKMTGFAVSNNSTGQIADPHSDSNVERISNREEVEKLIKALNGTEAEVVRLYHLEGKTYHEISSAVGMPENSIGPTLSRAREKMRGMN